MTEAIPRTHAHTDTLQNRSLLFVFYERSTFVLSVSVLALFFSGFTNSLLLFYLFQAKPSQGKPTKKPNLGKIDAKMCCAGVSRSVFNPAQHPCGAVRRVKIIASTSFDIDRSKDLL